MKPFRLFWVSANVFTSCLLFSLPSFAQTPCGGQMVEDNAKYDWSREDSWFEPVCEQLNQVAGAPTPAIKCSIDHKSYDQALASMLKLPKIKRHFICMEFQCQFAVSELYSDTGWPGTAFHQPACKAELAKKVKSVTCLSDPRRKDSTVTLKNGVLTFINGTEQLSNHHYIDDKLVAGMFPCFDKVAKDLGHDYAK